MKNRVPTTLHRRVWPGLPHPPHGRSRVSPSLHPGLKLDPAQIVSISPSTFSDPDSRQGPPRARHPSDVGRRPLATSGPLPPPRRDRTVDTRHTRSVSTPTLATLRRGPGWDALQFMERRPWQPVASRPRVWDRKSRMGRIIDSRGVKDLEIYKDVKYPLP